MADVIEYVRWSKLYATNLNTAHIRKCRSRLYHIVEDDLATKVTTKWKLGFRKNSLANSLIFPYLQMIWATFISIFIFEKTEVDFFVELCELENSIPFAEPEMR